MDGWWLVGGGRAPAACCADAPPLPQNLQSLADDAFADDGASARARAWLFVSYVLAFGSVAGAASVLAHASSVDPPAPARVRQGVGSVLQTAFTLASALPLWVLRSADDDGGAFIY